MAATMTTAPMMTQNIAGVTSFFIVPSLEMIALAQSADVVLPDVYTVRHARLSRFCQGFDIAPLPSGALW